MTYLVFNTVEVDGSSTTHESLRGNYYRTGDVARCDPQGYYTYVGRADDVFKASDYRISHSNWKA